MQISIFFKRLIKLLEIKGVFENLKKGLDFHLFILSNEREFLIPLSIVACLENTNTKIDIESCKSQWLDHLELVKGVKDVVKAKCYAERDILMIPIMIHREFAGLIGACISKSNMCEADYDKIIFLFKAISLIIEEMGNKEYRISEVMHEFTDLTNDILKNYDVKSGINVFLKINEVIRKILLRGISLTRSHTGVIILFTPNGDRLIFPQKEKICKLTKYAPFINSLKEETIVDEGHSINEIFDSSPPSECLVTPIRTFEKTIGCIIIQKGEEKARFSFEDKKYTDILSMQLSISIENSNLFQSIGKTSFNLSQNIYSNFFNTIDVLKGFNQITERPLKALLDEQFNILGLNNPDYKLFIRDKDNEIRFFEFGMEKSNANTQANFIVEDELNKRLEDPAENELSISLDESNNFFLFFKNINKEEAQRVKDFINLISNLVKTFWYGKLFSRNYMNEIYTLIMAIRLRDPYKSEHTDKVIDIAIKIAYRLKLPKDDIMRLRIAAIFSDIGLISVPSDILNKKTRLSEDEFEKIKRHPYITCSILRPIKELEEIIPIIQSHHEYYDGSGYPDGLKGEEIPLLSRILLVADSYTAMLENRIYRPAITFEKLIEELEKDAGARYDPAIIKILLEHIIKNV